MIVSIKSPYVVEDMKYHLHANKTKKHADRIEQAIIGNCAVIYNHDQDFGKIELLGETSRPSCEYPVS